MKIFICFLFYSVSFLLIADSGGEKVKINERFESIPLNQVLRILRTKYSLKIAYGEKYTRNVIVSTSLENNNVFEAFEKILKGSNLTFEQVDTHAIIIKKIKKNKGVSPKINIVGVIKDGLTGESLPYAHVKVISQDRGVISNVEGYFSISEISSEEQIKVSFIGYKDALIDIRSHQQKKWMQISLVPKIATLSEVVVFTQETSKFESNHDQVVGEVSFNPLLTKDVVNVGEADIFRTIQLLPGINATNEASAGLNINGGVSSQNLLLFDGFTVYHLDHFFGYFSSFNPKAVKAVNLYKTGFDARFGGRSSSVINITGKDGNQHKTSGSLGVNFLSVNTSLEIPLSDNGTTLFFSGRRSFTDIYGSSLFESIFSIFENTLLTDQTDFDTPDKLKVLESKITPDFYYSDFNLKISGRIGLKNRLSFSFYDSNDILNFTEIFKASYTKEEDISVINSGLIKWGNVGFSLNLSRYWNAKHYTSMLASFSEFKSKYNRQSFTTENILESGRIDYSSLKQESNGIQDISLKIDHEWQLDGSNKIELGAMHSIYEVGISSLLNDSIIVDYGYKNKWLTSAYLQTSFNPFSNLMVRPGIRVNYLSTTSKGYFEPRFSFNYKINNRLNFYGATGKYYQFINQSYTKNTLQGIRNLWVLSDSEDVPVQYASHYSLGFDYKVLGFNVSLNYFHKRFKGLLEYALYFGDAIIETENNQTFYQGTGVANGIEILLKKDFGNFNGWTSYTWNRVLYTFPKLNRGETFYADHDQRHEINIAGQYTKDRFSFSLTWLYGSGKPYSNIEISPPKMGNKPGGDKIKKIEVNNRNTMRLPNYHRLDLAATYTFKIGNVNSNVKLSVFNVYDQKNILDKTFSIIGSMRENRTRIVHSDVKLMGVTPTLSFELTF